jgi:hypothetical protein
MAKLHRLRADGIIADRSPTPLYGSLIEHGKQ